MADQNLTLKIKVGVDGQPQVELLNTSLQKVQNTTKSMGTNFNSLATGLKALAGAWAVREVVSFGQSIIDMGDELQKASRKSGLAVEDLAKLKTSAELAGLGFDQLQNGLKKLSVNMVEAKGGNEQLLAVFKEAGIGAKELKNLNLDQALSKIADRFAATADGAEKMALSTKLFGGRVGTEFINFLDGGSEGIHKFGINIGSEFAKQAEMFNDNMKLMKNSLTNIGIEALGPNLKGLSTFFVYLGVEIDFVITRLKMTFTYLTGLAGAIKGALSGESMNQISARRESVNAELRELDDGFKKRGRGALIDYETFGLPKASVEKKTINNTGSGANVKKIETETNALDDYITKQKESVALLELEGQKVQMSELENKKRAETIKHNTETERDASKFTGDRLLKYKKESDAFLKQKLELMELNDQQKKTFGYGAKEAFNEYVTNAQNTAMQVKEAFSGSFKQLEDALVNFVKTGKLNFADLVTFIADALIEIAIKQAVLAPLLGALGSLISGGIGAGTGGASFTSAGGSTAGINVAANGGIMTSAGMAQLKTYSRGGVANSPQMAIFGEGSTPEAYVPLPDGRRIPVALQGGGKSGGDTNVSVVVNVESGKDDVKSEATKGKALGNLMVAAIRNELIQQKRPGGLLT